MSILCNLSHDVLRDIFVYFDRIGLIIASNVCSSFYKTIMESFPHTPKLILDELCYDKKDRWQVLADKRISYNPMVVSKDQIRASKFLRFKETVLNFPTRSIPFMLRHIRELNHVWERQYVWIY